MTRAQWTRRAGRSGLIAILTGALMGIGASAVWASASEEHQGEALLHQVQSGQLPCAKVTPAQFELIGEYAMGRMVGSTAAHEAMNERLKTQLGSAGEEQAHEFLGARSAGCPTGAAPASYGTMMGMMGGSDSGTASGGMMGGSQNGAQSGSMMGNGYSAGSHMHEEGMSSGAIVAIILGGIVLVGLIVLLALRWKPRPPANAGTAQWARER